MVQRRGFLVAGAVIGASLCGLISADAQAQQSPSLEDAISSFVEVMSNKESLIAHTSYDSPYEGLIDTEFPATHNGKTYDVKASLDKQEGTLTISINGNQFFSKLDGSDYRGPEMGKNTYASILETITNAKKRDFRLAQKARKLARLVFTTDRLDVSGFDRFEHKYAGTPFQGRADTFYEDDLYFSVHADATNPENPGSYSGEGFRDPITNRIRGEQLYIRISTEALGLMPAFGKESAIIDRKINGIPVVHIHGGVYEKLIGTAHRTREQGYELVLDKLIVLYEK